MDNLRTNSGQKKERNFPYLTVGTVLKTVQKQAGFLPSRPTFYRLEKIAWDLGIIPPMPGYRKVDGEWKLLVPEEQNHRWRLYKPDEVEALVNFIRDRYSM